LQKPQQFINDTFQVDFFGGYQGESMLKIESHLVSKNTNGTSAGAICFFGPVVENMP
jgi:hypothetical protein